MAAPSAVNKNAASLKLYRGDNKTLLAFNLPNKSLAKNLAGFTIQCTPPGQPSYYLFNELQLQSPGDHAQVASEPANSSINAPIQKFRWVHVTGQNHQGIHPATGTYKYTITPRYFDKNGSLQPLDSSLSAVATVNVGPFVKNGLSLGFTRGYMQSEAFTHHFGLGALIRPKGNALTFDTSQPAGSNAQGQRYTYLDEYQWMGSTARVAVFEVLNEVLGNPALHLDLFAYDLNEPDVITILLKLAKQGRIRVILDNAPLHHNAKSPKPEDQFTTQFQKTATGKAAILRGHFGRFSHDKVFIVSSQDGTNPATAMKVLTGSTNFSVTGLYVNANHVLIFNDPAVAKQYSAVFNEVWNDKVSETFNKTALAATPFTIQSAHTPPTTITFSPHTTAEVATILGGLSDRILQEAKKGVKRPSVLFAVMQLTGSQTPVYQTLQKLHATETVFSYGISDSPGGVSLHQPGQATGVLVTGKPGQTLLPPPFDQVPSPPGHEIHDKFVVCGFNGDNPVVYCGSSNLASGGEAENGDNLIAIRDGDVAACFAIEALLLVDHYSFLDRYAKAKAKAAGKTASNKRAPLTKQPRSKRQAAVEAEMYLAPDDKWAATYFDPNDLHSMERQLFG